MDFYYNTEIYDSDPLKKYRLLMLCAKEAPFLSERLLILQRIVLFLVLVLNLRGGLFLGLLIGGLNIFFTLYLKELSTEYADLRELDLKKEDLTALLFERFVKSAKILYYTVLNSLFLMLYTFIYMKIKGNINPESYMKMPYIALFIFNIFTTLLLFYLEKKRENVDKMEVLMETNMLEEAGIYIPEVREHINDVKLVINADSGQDVIWREDDRFVHMLILGPTGSGKTSQIIIPLINQDIQSLESGITVIEPKDDLAEKVYAMAQHYGRKSTYFNPVLDFCPSYNPLYGKEEDVVETMVTTFKMLNPDSPQYFQDINEQLIRNALTVLKRLRGNKATMIELETIVANPNSRGKLIVQEFQRLGAPTDAMAKQNIDISSWFLDDYFQENSKLYENCSGFRAQISKIVSNKYLRKVLNPENGESDINFDNHLISNGVLAIATAQGKLGDLGSFLGYFLILSLQAAVFKRPKAYRPNHFLYIDEFQVYSNPGFANMLTQGRSYKVASHLATQNRALIGMGSGSTGRDFIELVSTNARNVVIFPGGNAQDAKYYEAEVGEIMTRSEDVSVSRGKMELMYPGSGGKSPTESIKVKKGKEAKFSSNDLIYQDFGTVFYKIVKDKSLQSYQKGEIEFIPYELNKKLDKMVAENYALMMNGINPDLCRDQEREGILFDKYVEPTKRLVELYKDKEKFELLDQFDKAEEINKEIEALNKEFFEEVKKESYEALYGSKKINTKPKKTPSELDNITLDTKKTEDDVLLMKHSEEDVKKLDKEIKIIKDEENGEDLIVIDNKEEFEILEIDEDI